MRAPPRHPWRGGSAECSPVPVVAGLLFEAASQLHNLLKKTTSCVGLQRGRTSLPHQHLVAQMDLSGKAAVPWHQW